MSGSFNAVLSRNFTLWRRPRRGGNAIDIRADNNRAFETRLYDPDANEFCLGLVQPEWELDK
jgi:hypothetical protein